MKNEKIVENYVLNLIYQMLTILLPIITTPYLSRVLGAENIGIYGYTISIVTYFTLLGALGITKYGQREIAYVQNDRAKRSKIFWELNIIKFFTVSVASIIFFCVFCIKGKYVLFYRILLLELFAVVMDISWFFQGIEDFKKVVIRNSTIKLVSLICIFLLVKTQDDLLEYFIIYILSNVIGNALFWVNIKKYIDKVSFKNIKLKKHIKPMISLFIPQIAASIYTVLDKTMLGYLESDISEVGYYEQSQKIVKVALTFVTALSIVMIPRISNVYAKGDSKKIKDYMVKSFTFDWFLSCPIIFGIIAIADKFVPWFFGAGYDKIIYLLIYSSPIVIFISLSTTIGSQYFTSIKKQHIQTIAVIVGAIINVVLNILLIPSLKSYGAIISTVVAELIITTIEVIYLIRVEKFSFKDITTGTMKYILAGFIMFIFIKVLSGFMNISALNTIIQIVAGLFIYIFTLVLLKDKWVNIILKKIISFKKESDIL